MMTNKITIFSKEDLTDIRLQGSEVKKLTLKEYSDLFDDIQFRNEKAEELVTFICAFKNGEWMPEKCNAYEPIKEKFNSLDFSAPIHWLSQRGSALYLKKLKPFKSIIALNLFFISLLFA